ncbi:coiled-coil domain-containing protein-domain-containing protein [Phlyctochytrium arcticum]|nr:coiled-coil domain-containing protein-domain-containing protein [Phlyctochytrium arcticum]
METSTIQRLVESVRAHPNFLYKPLRLNEEPIPEERQLEFMHDTLREKPGLFLESWGKFLSEEDLSLFDPYSDMYEVRYFLNHFRQEKRGPTRAQIRNRRLNYMNQNAASAYFSDESFQERDPALYEEFVGRHIPPITIFPDSMSLVERIYSNIDRAKGQEGNSNISTQDEEQYQEFDTDDEEEERAGEAARTMSPAPGTEGDERNSSSPPSDDEDDAEREPASTMTDAKREELFDDFRDIMRQRFQDGKEKDFDYSAVDRNSLYDLSDEALQDAADSYFDSEEPSADVSHSAVAEFDY